MIKVICVADYYLPGFKGGGPIRTIANMRRMLREYVEIAIFTRDRDLGSDNPYPTIYANCWIETSDGPIYYASPKKFTASGLKEAIEGKGYEILYLNSFFSYRGSIEIYQQLKHQLKTMRILLAPRGEFSSAALNLKRNKKQAYLKLCRLFGCYSEIYWHASTANEHEDIARQFPSAVQRIHIAEDPVDIGELPDYSIESSKINPGVLRLAFISRISPMKNLDGLLRILAMTTRKIELDIYGPIEDAEYWKSCQRLIALVPGSVMVTYKGALEPESVSPAFAKYDLFAFPTRGENFGHVIFEALRVGTPVLVSDQTPWKEDRDGALSVLPLNNEMAWSEYLNAAADRSVDAKLKIRQSARTYAEHFANSSEIIEKNLAMFSVILGKTALLPGKNGIKS